ncbi:MAG: hypothetical protein J5706_09400 [Elusimicrobiales bacterium]|nr:hypothetical protein [Elusimicrobiales bacterium]
MAGMLAQNICVPAYAADYVVSTNSSSFRDDVTSIIQGGDTLTILNNGYVSGIAVSAVSGKITVNGGRADYISVYGGMSSGVYMGGIYDIKGGSAFNTYIYGGVMYVSGSADYAYIYSGGTMTVNGGSTNYANIYSGGTMTVNGGSANNATVSSGGTMTVNGGTASSARTTWRNTLKPKAYRRRK